LVYADRRIPEALAVVVCPPEMPHLASMLVATPTPWRGGAVAATD